MEVAVGSVRVMIPQAALPPSSAVALDVLYGGPGGGLRRDTTVYAGALVAVGAVKTPECVPESWIAPGDFFEATGMDWPQLVRQQGKDRLTRAIALRMAWQQASRGGRLGWLAGFRRLWESVVPYRVFPLGHAGRALKGAVQTLGLDVVERAWRQYLLGTEPMAANPTRFVDRLPSFIPRPGTTVWSEVVARVGCGVCTFGHLDREVTSIWDCPGPELTYRSGPSLCAWGSGLWRVWRAYQRRGRMPHWPSRYWGDLSVWLWTHADGAYGSCREHPECHETIAAETGWVTWADVGFLDEYEGGHRNAMRFPWMEHYDRLYRRQFFANLGAEWAVDLGGGADCDALSDAASSSPGTLLGEPSMASA